MSKFSIFISTLLISAIFLYYRNGSFSCSDKLQNSTLTNNYNKDQIEILYYTSREELAEAIDIYIQSISKTSTMRGLAFVDECDKYNVDVRFALAQAQLESHFATEGLGGKMNSAFNVGAFDGRGTMRMVKYEHPNYSIEPFLKLITTKYLVNGKTESDLLKKYVNEDGKRYASYSGYEKTLTSIYTKISGTEITEKYNIYKKYKVLTQI